MEASTVFEALKKHGHDEDFEPKSNELFFPTMFSLGSEQKIEVLRQRVELGLPLWHKDDEPICSVVGIGGDKSRDGATYGKTASFFAVKLKKSLGD